MKETNINLTDELDIINVEAEIIDNEITEAKDNNKEIISQKKEQPMHNETVYPATAEEKNTGTSINEEDSSLGKFKDVESLMEAYKNLQAEFTRKSQKLSEYTKQLENINDNANKVVPVYEQENWQEQVGEFLKVNPEAKKYANEISEAILNDKVLVNNKNSLEFAWAKVLASKYKTPETLASDEEFLNTYILKDEKVKKKIIENYLDLLQQNKATPLISSHTGSAFSLTPKNRPKTLSEASKLAEAFFKI